MKACREGRGFLHAIDFVSILEAQQQRILAIRREESRRPHCVYERTKRWKLLTMAEPDGRQVSEPEFPERSSG